MFNAVIVGLLICSVGYTWLTLFLLLRVQRRGPLIVAGLLALFGLAVFFTSATVRNITTSREMYIFMQRGMLWSAFLPLAAWFHFAYLLYQQIRANPPRRVSDVFAWPVLPGYVAALVLTLLAAGTNLLMDYDTVTRLPNGTFYEQAGVVYPFNILFNLLLAGGALVYLALALRHLERQALPTRRMLRQQVRLLTGGAVLFLLGALWWPTAYWRSLTALPGVVVLCLGLATVGYAMAQFGLLLEGQDAQRDFVYSSVGMVLVQVLYLGMFAISGQLTAGSALLVLLLVTLSHTAFDTGRNWLDQFFFSREEREARAEARAYAANLAINPVAAPDQDEQDQHDGNDEGGSDDEGDTDAASPTPADAAISTQPPAVSRPFKSSVRRAITDLKSPPRLAQSPLLTLDLVSERLQQEQREDNRLNRTAMLREVLLEYIDALRPAVETSAQVGDAWRFYNVLYYPYVRETSRKAALAELRQRETSRQRSGQQTPDDLEDVLRWLVDIEDATFYKWQRRASDTIATSLWEDNQQARQRRGG